MKKVSLTDQDFAHAEGQLRFALNMIEGVLVTLGSSLDASVYAAQQPEVVRAFRHSKVALDRAYTTIRRSRDVAASQLHRRALGIKSLPKTPR